MHKAALAGNLATLKSLCSELKDKTLIDARNERGSTSLHVAAHHGQMQAAELLLHMGANPNLPDTAHGSNSALGNAILKSHLSVVRLLARLTDMTFGNTEGDTPLHLAVGVGQAELVHVVLSAISLL